MLKKEGEKGFDTLNLREKYSVVAKNGNREF